MKNIIAFLLLVILSYGCTVVPEQRNTDQKTSFFQKVNEIPDSITAPGVVVYNLFKHQILAHAELQYDSLLIVDKHGPDSWLDIYELPVKAVLEKSGYAAQFN